MSTSGRRAALPAAGGVVWRRDGADLLVALVHRPRYDDWTLPKGKIETDEPALLAGVREVAEETGAEVQVGRRLNCVQYSIGGGERKRVSYWAMRYVNGEHVPSAEVDAIRWLTVAEAARLLTYPVDRGVLADFARLPADGGIVLLLRHAKAGKRSEYSGDDRLRPLDKLGRRHARASAPTLLTFRPERVIAADRVRCEQTARPLADLAGLPLVTSPEYSDEAYAEDPLHALGAVREFGEAGGVTMICSQGGAIPGLLSDLEAPVQKGYPTRKGSVWALGFAGRRVISADYYPHPER